MILDELLEFADDTAANGNGVTVLVGDVIDMGATPSDYGTGRAMYLVIQVSTAYVGGTSVQFTLASDAAAAIATDGSATEHFISDAFAVASLTAGAVPVIAALPSGVGTLTEYERYLGVLATTVGNVTAGSINAFLTYDVARWKSYADAVN